MLNKILSQNPELLDGTDLLLFNLAYMIDSRNITWDLETIDTIMKQFEVVLDEMDNEG